MTSRRAPRRPIASPATLLTTRTRKVKTSVSLSEGLLQAVDALAGKTSRSAWIERSVRASVQRALRRQRDENDVRLLNEHADNLDHESADALAYQTPWDVERTAVRFIGSAARPAMTRSDRVASSSSVARR